MRTDRHRIGIVGLGKMGFVHLCVLNVLPNVEVVALCEKSSMIRRLLKKVFKTATLVDDTHKLADLDLDAVYVTTPIPSHFPIARTIYLEKIARNMFIEKTLASTYREASEVCDLARKFGGTNMVGYLRRFYVTFQKAKELLSQDAVGSVLSFKAYAYSSDFFGIEQDQRVSSSRGGVLRDLGCHVIDLALWFFGDFQIDSAMKVPTNSASANGSEDLVKFNAKNPDGVAGEFGVSWCMEKYRLPEAGLSVKGTKGTLTVDDDKVQLDSSEGASLRWFRQDLNDSVPFLLGLPEYYREDLHFVQSMANRAVAEPDFNTASKVDKIISEVEKKVGEEV